MTRLITLIAGGETVVNDSSDGDQREPSITVLSDGSYVIVWSANMGDDNGRDIWIQKFNADGSPTGDQTYINTYTNDDQTHPEVVATPNGGYVVAWVSYGQDGDSTGIFFRAFDASGNPFIASDTRVNMVTTDMQDDVAITALAGGGFVLSWNSYGQDGSGFGVYARVYDEDGGAVIPEFQVSEHTASDQTHASVAALADGGFVVTFFGYQTTGLSEELFMRREDIYVRHFNANGEAVGGDQLVNTTTDFSQVDPVVAGLAGGGYVIAWSGDGQDGYGYGIFAQRFDANDHKVGDEFQVNTTIFNDENHPAIAALANGGFVIVWQISAETDDTTVVNTYAQAYDASGQPIDEEQVVNSSDALGGDVMPEVAATADGFIITWASGADGDFDILQRSYSIDGDTILTGTAGDDTMDGTTVAAVTMKGLGGNDTYKVDDSGDLVVETLNGGTDMVRSSVTYTLTANVEELTLTGSNDIDGTGNALDNVMFGNDANNALDGGQGDDSLYGMFGYDTLNGGDGDDYLDGGVYRDELHGGRGDDTLVGGTGPDTLYGDQGNDRLDGEVGLDSLAGGAGNDTYVVDNEDDVVHEDSDNGTDLVLSTVTWTLGDDVENLTLVGGNDVDGTGNGLGNIIIGNDGANSISSGGGDDSLSGGDGNDTLDSDYDNDTLDGGDGDDVLLGGKDEDVLTGGAGNDRLNGGKDADDMYGGLGNDTYVVDNGFDHVNEFDDQGIDLVESSTGYTLSNYVENLTLTGESDINGGGNGLANIIIGNAGANYISSGGGGDSLSGGDGNDTLDSDYNNDTLDGGDGNDVLLGGDDADVLRGGDGNDRLNGGNDADNMSGGLGNDTYVVDNGYDSITELDDQGIDLVESSTSYTLSAYVENLTLTGESDMSGTGNRLGNIIIGNAGANSLSSGAGDDSLSGGDGNDSLDSGGDNDTLDGGDGSDVLLSGDGADVLRGGAGNDSLNGGTGADTMTGGSGGDVYTVDSTSDQIIETDLHEDDLVYASATYTLSANVEDLTLTGSDNINGTGNDENNEIRGNSGNNILTGGAGADVLSNESGGNDTLIGGTGDDMYIVAETDTVITENATEGDDTVFTLVSYTLSDNIETLWLFGAGNIDATGNGDANSLIGTTGDNVLDGKAGDDTMIGGDGNDTFYVDSAGDVVIDGFPAGMLPPGMDPGMGGVDEVISSATFTLDEGLENLTLSGSGNINGTGNGADNYITGNGGDNYLTGGDGNDSLSGGWEGGHDTLSGGSGDDAYVVMTSDAVIIEGKNGGHDSVMALATYTLAANVEDILLYSADDINATGNASDNYIIGGSGNNVLNGMGGADTMISGDGNDIYYVNSVLDVVIDGNTTGGFEFLAIGADPGLGGIDRVMSSVDWVLGDDIENLTLLGSVAVYGTGNSGDNVIQGNSANNLLNGLGGDDRLIGNGGRDTLYGGAGNDTYTVDSTDDFIAESHDGRTDAGGTDMVYSSVDWTLGRFMETLYLTGSADASATGNDDANTLRGNAGANLIDGGAGADTMSGGLGNDTFVVDNTGDLLSETATGGTDTVLAGISYALRTNFENLTLTGEDNLTAKGNTLDNILTGNSGANILDGKAGADTLYGGAGNDTYYVDSLNDRLSEQTVSGTDDGGFDKVVSLVNWTLGEGFENLTLAGTSAINATGNGDNNIIRGNSGDNVLRGMGGNDNIIGYDGADTFRFEKAGLANGKDSIYGFASGTDHLAFSSADYGLDEGHTLTAEELTIGTKAVGSAAQFVFNSATHTLYWDADGAGGAAPTAIAVLYGVTSLQASDFLFE